MKKKAVKITSKKITHDAPTTIQEHLEDFMSIEHNNLCSTGRFTVKDFRLLARALSGNLDNFIIFDNAGGKPFDIAQCDNSKELAKLSKFLQKYLYMQKINGKETIIRKLPNY